MTTFQKSLHQAARSALQKTFKWLLILLLAIALLACGYLLVAYQFAYSQGESVGYVQKISYKGWLCKTWEGEQVRALSVVPTVPEKFAFTVRDQAVVESINASIGQKVVLQYAQHKGLPSCFGETEYFAIGVQLAPEAPAPAATGQPSK